MRSEATSVSWSAGQTSRVMTGTVSSFESGPSSRPTKLAPSLQLRQPSLCHRHLLLKLAERALGFPHLLFELGADLAQLAVDAPALFVQLPGKPFHVLTRLRNPRFTVGLGVIRLDACAVTLALRFVWALGNIFRRILIIAIGLASRLVLVAV